MLHEFISGVGEQEALNSLNDLPAFNGMKPTQTMSPHLTALYDTYIKELSTAHTHVIGNPVINQSLISSLQAIGAGKLTPEAAMQAVQATALAQQKAQ